jgi:PAS domain S-box-containing protein
MVRSVYPFIDIAVLDPVRSAFLAGDAIVVLDAELEEIIWANGAGAVLFGYDDVETARSADANLGMAARRQIAATPGFPRIGSGRSLLVRLPQGLASRAIGFVASQVRLPDGGIAIMLAAPDAKAESRSPAEAGARAIHGIAQDGQHAALVGPNGEIIAQSEAFSRIGVSDEVLAALAGDVANEADRLAKRLVRVKGRSLPAGIALLADNPLRALVIVVEDAQIDEPAAQFSVSQSEPDARPAAAGFAPTEDNWQFADSRLRVRQSDRLVIEGAPATQGQIVEIEKTADGFAAHERLPVSDATIAEKQDERASADERAVPTGIAFDEPAIAGAEAADEQRELTGAGEMTGDDTAPQTAAGSEKAGPPEISAPRQEAPWADEAPASFVADPDASPVRFVWKTDADGRFSSLSPDFAKVVGTAAADVIGQKFRDVARRFALDPDGEIAGLLERRDTWSGRSVMWPVTGTDLKVPVDLAALPVYGRDRNFEGFRGFGVVRAGDAMVDEDAIGLALAGRASANAPSESGAEESPSPSESKGPFGKEVPVLDVEATPGRRTSDKVIHLAEHRPGPPERSLSTTESNAFREIAARLREAEKQVPPAANGNAGAPAMEPEGDRAKRTDPPEEPAHADAVAEHVTTAWDDEDGQFVGDAADTDQPDRDRSLFDADTDFASGEADATPGQDGGAEDHSDETRDSTFLLEKLPVPVLVHAGDTLHYANDEFLKLTGYASLGEFEAAGGLDTLFVEGGEATPEDDHRRRLRTRDGQEFPVEALLQSVPWNGGKALLLALKADAEPQISAAAPAQSDQAGDLDLRLAEMRAILDTATDGIIIINNEATIRSMSRPAEALFGFDSFELVGKPFVSLFAVESQRAARDYLNGLSDNGVASVLNDGREVIGREAQGRFIPLFMTIGRLPGGNGYCAVLRDITQWKRAEEELTQARAKPNAPRARRRNFSPASATRSARRSTPSSAFPS